MATFGAAELFRDGKGIGLFHFTCTDGSGTRPLGYCADNCPGHPTRAEAEDHWEQYCLDNFKSHTNDKEQHRCAICGEWTQTTLQYGPGWAMPEWHDLCLVHANRDGLKTAVDKHRLKRRM